MKRTLITLALVLITAFCLQGTVLATTVEYNDSLDLVTAVHDLVVNGITYDVTFKYDWYSLGYGNLPDQDAAIAAAAQLSSLYNDLGLVGIQTTNYYWNWDYYIPYGSPMYIGDSGEFNMYYVEHFYYKDASLGMDGWYQFNSAIFNSDNAPIFFADFVVVDSGTTSSSVPVPAPLLLLGSGLVGFAGIKRKFKQ